MPVCVLGRENHPLAGYRWVLLRSCTPVYAGSGMVAGLQGGVECLHNCLLHCWVLLACVVRESVCLVLQAPAGRLESLMLSPSREHWPGLATSTSEGLATQPPNDCPPAWEGGGTQHDWGQTRTP